jgi:hypothetical protein
MPVDKDKKAVGLLAGQTGGPFDFPSHTVLNFQPIKFIVSAILWRYEHP